MTHFRFVRLPVTLAVLAACATAHADYTSPDGQFRLSGFGTLGLSRSSTDDALFNYPGQGGGSTKRASLNPDSKIALQGTYKFTPTVSGTVQAMLKYDAAGDYIPNAEWAFAKWQATPALSVRAGRMGAPFFMVSDFRDVGYANTAVRPNLDVYGQVPVSYFEGADASYQFNLASTTVTSTLWAGNSNADFSSALTRDPSEVKLKNLVGLNLVGELDNGLTLRLGHSQGKLSVRSQVANELTAGAASSTLRAGLAALSPSTLAELNAMTTLVNPQDVNASFTGIGVSYDQNNWVAAAEYTKRKTDSYVSDTTGWYTLLGYRVGKFTPYASVSKISVDRASTNPVNLVNTISSQVNAGVANLYGGTNVILGTQLLDQRTTSIGLRWDAASKLAIKAQYDRIVKPENSNGLFLVADPTSATAAAFSGSKKTINVLTLSVDFVF